MGKHMKKFRDFCEGKQIERVEDLHEDGIVFTFADNTKIYIYAVENENETREELDYFIEDYQR